MASNSEQWFCRVRLDVDGEARTCLIGPLAWWTDARALAAAWEREFGAGTTDVRCGRPARFRFEGAKLRIVPAAIPTSSGGWLSRPIRCWLSAPGSSR